MLEQEFNARIIGGCVIIKSLLVLPILFWELGGSDEKIEIDFFFFFDSTFFEETYSCWIPATLNFFLNCIFYLCLKKKSLRCNCKVQELRVYLLLVKANQGEPGCAGATSLYLGYAGAFSPTRLLTPTEKVYLYRHPFWCGSWSPGLEMLPYEPINSGINVFIASQTTFL